MMLYSCNTIYFKVDIAKDAFHQEASVDDDEEEEEEEREASPKAVGHNIYILATQVCITHNIYNSQHIQYICSHHNGKVVKVFTAVGSTLVEFKRERDFTLS